jgi:hypothetical protein
MQLQHLATIYGLDQECHLSRDPFSFNLKATAWDLGPLGLRGMCLIAGAVALLTYVDIFHRPELRML